MIQQTGPPIDNVGVALNMDGSNQVYVADVSFGNAFPHTKSSSNCGSVSHTSKPVDTVIPRPHTAQNLELVWKMQKYNKNSD